MTENEVLHKLRNAHGLSYEELRKVRLSAADWIERYRDAYENMKQFAEANGLNTVVSNSAINIRGCHD